MKLKLGTDKDFYVAIGVVSVLLISGLACYGVGWGVIASNTEDLRNTLGFRCVEPCSIGFFDKVDDFRKQLAEQSAIAAQLGIADAVHASVVEALRGRSHNNVTGNNAAAGSGSNSTRASRRAAERQERSRGSPELQLEHSVRLDVLKQVAAEWHEPALHRARQRRDDLLARVRREGPNRRDVDTAALIKAAKNALLGADEKKSWAPHAATAAERYMASPFTIGCYVINEECQCPTWDRGLFPDLLKAHPGLVFCPQDIYNDYSAASAVQRDYSTFSILSSLALSLSLVAIALCVVHVLMGMRRALWAWRRRITFVVVVVDVLALVFLLAAPVMMRQGAAKAVGDRYQCLDDGVPHPELRNTTMFEGELFIPREDMVHQCREVLLKGSPLVSAGSALVFSALVLKIIAWFYLFNRCLTDEPPDVPQEVEATKRGRSCPGLLRSVSRVHKSLLCFFVVVVGAMIFFWGFVLFLGKIDDLGVLFDFSVDYLVETVRGIIGAVAGIAIVSALGFIIMATCLTFPRLSRAFDRHDSVHDGLSRTVVGAGYVSTIIVVLSIIFVVAFAGAVVMLGASLGVQFACKNLHKIFIEWIPKMLDAVDEYLRSPEFQQMVLSAFSDLCSLPKNVDILEECFFVMLRLDKELVLLINAYILSIYTVDQSAPCIDLRAFGLDRYCLYAAPAFCSACNLIKAGALMAIGSLLGILGGFGFFYLLGHNSRPAIDSALAVIPRASGTFEDFRKEEDDDDDAADDDDAGDFDVGSRNLEMTRRKPRSSHV